MMQLAVASQQAITPPSQEVLVSDYPTGRALLEHPVCLARPPHADRAGQPGLDSPRELLAALWQQLLFADTATHQRLRAALDRPLARMNARLLPGIQQRIVRLLERAAAS